MKDESLMGLIGLNIVAAIFVFVFVALVMLAGAWFTQLIVNFIIDQSNASQLVTHFQHITLPQAFAINLVLGLLNRAFGGGSGKD